MTTYTSLKMHWPLRDWPNSNADRRKHWTRQRKEAREIRAAARALAQDIPPVETPVNVTVLFGFPDKRRRDLDNYSVKAALDGIVDSRIIPGDDTAHIASVTRRLDQRKSSKGEICVTIQLVTVGA